MKVKMGVVQGMMKTSEVAVFTCQKRSKTEILQTERRGCQSSGLPTFPGFRPLCFVLPEVLCIRWLPISI